MTAITDTPATHKWKITEKIALRTFFLYSIITFIPLAPSFYKQDFDSGFSVGSYSWRWLDVVSQNNPWFFSSQGGKNYFGWLITLLVCLAAGAVWTLISHRLKKNKVRSEEAQVPLESKHITKHKGDNIIADKSTFLQDNDSITEAKSDYITATNDNITIDNDSLTEDKLYNWFFILARYQIALRMSWFAIAKVFPVQMPFPTLSQLNTNLGDFTPGKLYWLTTGVSPFFEVFAGVFELIATILILFRRTATLGVLMMIAILLPIWFVNIGYDAGVELASFHILLLSVLLLAKDAGKFWDILIAHKQAVISYIQPPVLPQRWKRVTRISLKVAFIFLFLIYRGYEYGRLYANGKTFKLPLESGIQSFTGFYNVAEFRLNNHVIPYSPNDKQRWQNVVFEKFNTISIKVSKPFALNTNNKIRTTEYYGNIGRSFYGYEADTVKKQFLLNNRADTTSKIHLSYSRPNASKLILYGVNENKDSLYVVLNKVDKIYPLALKRKDASASGNE